MIEKGESKKQERVLEILSTFSNKNLEAITDGTFDFNKLTKKQGILFMECVWVVIGKEQATSEEIVLGIAEVFVLSSLELFKRLGLVSINKQGNFERTKLGEEVKKGLKVKK